jgi:hypothetical protein
MADMKKRYGAGKDVFYATANARGQTPAKKRAGTTLRKLHGK